MKKLLLLFLLVVAPGICSGPDLSITTTLQFNTAIASVTSTLATKAPLSGSRVQAYANGSIWSLAHTLVGVASYNTEVFDTLGEFTASTFTPLNSGQYLVSAHMLLSNVAWDAAGTRYIQADLLEDGSAIKLLQLLSSHAAVTKSETITFNTVVNMTAGKAYKIQVINSSSVTISNSSGADRWYISYVRLQ